MPYMLAQAAHRKANSFDSNGSRPHRVSSNLLLIARDQANLGFKEGSPPLSGRVRTVEIDRAWREALQAGRVVANFSAFVRGHRDSLRAKVVFLTDDDRELGELVLPLITPKESAGDSGMLPVRVSDRVPAETAKLRIIQGGAAGKDIEAASVNNLEVLLLEYQ